jgi:hypothetical protein
MVIALLFGLLASAQDDVTRQVRELVEQLSLDRIEDREHAARQLRTFGKAALAELRKPRPKPDFEGEVRISHVIRAIEVQEQIPAVFLAGVPGIVDRLLGSKPHEWTTLFLELAETDNEGNLTSSRWTAQDLSPLAGNALRGALTEGEKLAILGKVGLLRLAAACVEILPLLEDPSPHVRASTVTSLWLNKAGQFSTAVERLLQDPDGEVRHRALVAVRAMESKPALSSVFALLRDPAGGIRAETIETILHFRMESGIAGVVEALQDREDAVRIRATEALAVLAPKEVFRRGDVLSNDSSSAVRLAAAAVVVREGHREGGFDFVTIYRDMPSFSIQMNYGQHGSLGSWQPPSLGTLNRIRRPESWAHFQRTEAPREFKGTVQDALARIARDAGMELEVAQSSAQPLAKVAGRYLHSRSASSVLDVLERLVVIRYEFILEADRLRILPREQALDFWTSWRDEEQKRR